MGIFFDDADDMYDYFPGQFVYGDGIGETDEYMGEKWWYIDGAPGYMISDHGRVWSEKSQWFVKPKPMDKHGHMGVCLSVNGKPRYAYIHRLMAKAFIPNTYNDPIVRHLNDVPWDNDIDNLAWGTQRENWEDSYRNGNARLFTEEDREKGLEKLRRPVIATNLKTGEELRFRGQVEASKILGLQQSNVWKVLNGQRAHTQGWYFEYVNRRDDID